ncbi:MAG: TonB-dependent receptor, partial [Planctomycetota bacterium]|nr:TonB-dependent receptor [Planctomycetota bacterium]
QSGFNIHLKTYSGSYNTSNFTFHSNGGSKDELYFSVIQSYRDTGGYRKNSYFRSKDSSVSLGLPFSNEFNAELTLGIHNDEYGLPGYLTPTQIATLGRRATTSPDDNVETEDYYYKIRVNNSFEGIGGFTTDLSLRNKKSSFIWGVWSDYIDIDSSHLSPRYHKELNLGSIPAKITAGVDLLRDGGYLFGTNADKESTGVYILTEADLDADNYPKDGYLLSTGYRHEKVTYFFSGGGITARKTHKEDVFCVGMSGFTEGLTLYANYSKNFRFPAVDEYFSAPPFGGGLNTSLKPQDGNQTEIGMKWNPLIPTTLSFFRMNTDNEIFYNPSTFANENYDKILRSGSEVMLKFSSNILRHPGSGMIDNPAEVTL